MLNLISELNDAYKTILQLTGPTPDAFRDYGFNRLVPEAVATIRKASIELYRISDELQQVTGSLGDQVATLNTIALLFETMAEDDPLITREYVQVVRGAYVGERTDFDDFKLSPLFGDFTGFPPTYIQVGQNEILLNDSTALAEKMKEAGVDVKIDIYENGWHVFQQLPIPRAFVAVRDIAGWVKERMQLPC